MRSQKTLLKGYNIHEIMKLFKQNCEGKNDELLTLLLGIIWRCSLRKEYREKYVYLGRFSVLSKTYSGTVDMTICYSADIFL